MAGYIDTMERIKSRNQYFQSDQFDIKSTEKFAVDLRKSRRALCASQKRLKPVVLELDKLQNLISVLKRSLRNEDLEIKLNSIRSLYFVLTSSESYAKTALQSGIISEVLGYIQMKEKKLVYYAIKIASLLISASDSTTQQMINLGVIPKLALHICNPDTQIRNEVFFSCSNLLAGTEGQRMCVIQDAIFLKLIDGLCDSDQGVRQQAGYCFYNLSKNCTTNELIETAKCDFFKMLCRAMNEESNPQLGTGLVFILEEFLNKDPSILREDIRDSMQTTLESLMINEILAPIVQRVVDKHFPSEITETSPNIFLF